MQSRTGQRSYVVQDRRGTTFAVHLDQLKPYVPLGELGELAGLEGWDRDLDCILKVKDGPDGEAQYLVSWKGHPTQDWVTYTASLTRGWQDQIEHFHLTQRA